MHLASLLVLVSEEKAPPVIDIDGTVFVQFGLFALLYLALRYLLFQPYLEMRQARSAGIDGERRRAEEMEAMAREMEQDCEGRLARARARAEEMRQRLRAEGQAQEREMLSEARAAATHRLLEARRKIAAELQAAQQQIQAQAQMLARQMVARILGREA
ncbi:MAG: hypothetical protein RMK29_02475 [Myxococcales bacterium]|nr:hypothetical protein [Myxococcota bacterium]MDW8280546.1 hypothetical protein [Myxococcales bacterium]